MKAGAEWAAAVAALAAAAAAACSAYYAYSADTKQTRQEKQQYANKVYLGEAPAYEYTDRGSRRIGAGKVWRVVVNASGIQVENTWVEARDGRSLRIQGVQRCSMYALPVDFIPQHLYFSDPNGDWHRQAGRQVDSDFKPIPDDDQGVDSPWVAVIRDCSG